MAKQRTPNMGLVTLDDQDGDSFYADWVENLGKIDAADQDRQDDLDAEAARALAAEAGLQTVLATTLQAITSKSPARVAATSNLTLSGLQTVDSVALVDGDRVLVAGQTIGADRGIYIAHSGAWTRSPDADTTGELVDGTFIWIAEGAANGDSGFQLQNGPIVIGTTVQTWAPKLGAAASLWTIGSDSWLKANVNNVEYLSITRDSNAAAISATVKWSEGTAGVYTATTVSTAFPGAVDAFTLTYGTGGSMKTVTQGAVTRDSSTGAVTAAPALVVS